MSSDSKRQILRHAVATLAYRGGKALRAAPPSFPLFRVGDRSRTPVEILAHIGDLLDWHSGSPKVSTRGMTRLRFPGTRK